LAKDLDDRLFQTPTTIPLHCTMSMASAMIQYGDRPMWLGTKNN
jgi:hypothetical protein